MDVAIKKVTEREGQDRFVLVSATTREVITVHDVSEATLRSFFRGKGASAEMLNSCIAKARKDFSNGARRASVPVNDAQETMGDDDLLFELGLDDDD